MPSRPAPPPFETLAVVGVGLLGGSIALAARRRGVVRRVIGIGRDLERLAAARQSALIDVAADDLAAVRDADLIVVCTPVDRVADDLLGAARAATPAALLTDVGSTKGAIVRAVSSDAVAAARYIPSHPLAGSEKRGFEFADPELFAGRTCVLTPFAATRINRLECVEGFWSALGMRTVRLSPEEHDEILAVTSHLPHVVAAALVRLVTEREQPFAATGFRDATRIAGGDPRLWTPILLQNAAAVIRAAGRVQQDLQKLVTALEAADVAAIEHWLETARQRRAGMFSDGEQ